MATYFHGNPEIQVGPDGSLQTMVLMNPTTYVQYNNATANHNPPPPPPPQQQQNLTSNNNLLLLNPSSHDPSADNLPLLHGFIPRIHYNPCGPTETTHPARDTPRALSLSLSSEQQQQQQQQPVGSVSSAAGLISGLVLSSKYLKAAQELLDEVVNVNDKGISGNKDGLEKKTGSDTNKATVESSAGAGDGGEAEGKHAVELTAPERQEFQIRKAKLINMLDEVDQRYRQYHQQMQIIISSFEQVAGIGSAKTYTSLALRTISRQFRSLKEAITAQIKAANKSLGEEDKIEGTGSRLKFVDHHFKQQRALQQLGMMHHHNAWRPQRGLPERAVSVLRAWLFEHFLHPYPKDSDKIMLAKQTGLTRSQVSNWFINARVRLWKPMVEEMYLEETKEQEKNGLEDKKSKSEQQEEDSASKSIAYNSNQDKSSVSENQRNDLMSKHDSFINNHNSPSVSMSTAVSTSPMASFRNVSGFSIMGPSELEGITQGSPKKPRIHEMMQPLPGIPSVDMGIKVSQAGHQQIPFIESDTNFLASFGQYPIEETGRFEPEPFTPRYSGNGVSLTLGLPHCESFSGTHQSFLSSQNIQLERMPEIGEPNKFGAINTSTSHSSTAYDNISIQNQRSFAAQLLPDYVA